MLSTLYLMVYAQQTEHVRDHDHSLVVSCSASQLRQCSVCAAIERSRRFIDGKTLSGRITSSPDSIPWPSQRRKVKL